jgi:hypothetical protein
MNSLFVGITNKMDKLTTIKKELLMTWIYYKYSQIEFISIFEQLNRIFAAIY